MRIEEIGEGGEREGEMRAVVGRKWILWEAREEKERTFVLNLTLPALALSPPFFTSYFPSSLPSTLTLSPRFPCILLIMHLVIFFCSLFFSSTPSFPPSLSCIIYPPLSSLLFRASFRRLSPGRPAPRSHLPAPPLGAIPSPFNAGGGASPPLPSPCRVPRCAVTRPPALRVQLPLWRT